MNPSDDPREELVPGTFSATEDIAELKAQMQEMQMQIDILKETINVLKKDLGVDQTALRNQEKAAIIDALKISIRCRNFYPHYTARAAAIITSKLVIDVVIADGLGVEAAVHLADTVAAHLHIGDGLLGGLGDFLCLLVLFLLHDDFLLFHSGKSIAVHLAIFHGLLRRVCLFGAGCQSAIPPVP